MSWESVTLWIDKCCIPQEHPLLPVCVELIEKLVQGSQGMIVLLSWSCFSRLWCVCERAAFLVHHDPKDVIISMQRFLRQSSKRLFVAAARGISIDKGECHNEADRATLKAKVDEHYYSTQAFVTFAQSAAIPLIESFIAQLSSTGREM